MILITGATGHLGKATIDFLLIKGMTASSISAFVRDEAKAAELKSKGVDFKLGDYDDYSSMVGAFKGVDKLLLVSASDLMKRSKQQEDAVKAAVEAGVKHILYTSFDRKNETETSPIAMVAKAHLETEKNIIASGIPYTIFRNNLYMDGLPMFMGEKVMETGLFFPAGETKSAFAMRKDMAEATANVLISEGHENKVYALDNSENFSFSQIAAILSQVSGKNVPYINPDKETYVEALTKAGVPMEYIKIFAGFAEAIKQGEFMSESKDLEILLGRKPMTIDEFLKGFYLSKTSS